MTSSATTTSVFNKIDENNSFAITIPGYWSSRNGGGTNHKLQKLLELTSQNDIQLHVNEVRKRRNRVKTGDNAFNYLTLLVVKTR